MNSKQLVILIVAVVVVAGLGWIIKSKEQSSWQSKPEGIPGKVLPDFPLNDITRLKIETKDKAISLSKENGWVVVERDGYPANADQIAAVLRTFWELKPVQVVEAGESQYARLDVAPPKSEKGGGTSIEFSKGQQPIASVILGKNHQSNAEGGGSYPNGRFILVPDKKTVYVVANTLSDVQPEVVQWLNREFIEAGNAKSVQVTGKEGAIWELIKDNESAEWKFADAKDKEKVDAGKTAGVGSAFGSFADVAGKRDNILDIPPDQRKVKVTTSDGFVYDFTIGTEKDGNRHVTVDVSADLPAQRTASPEEKPEDKTRLDEEFKTRQEGLKKRLEKEKKYSEWVYRIPVSSLEVFFKTRADLIAPEPMPTPSPEPAAANEPVAPTAVQEPPPGPPVPVPTQSAPANP